MSVHTVASQSAAFATTTTASPKARRPAAPPSRRPAEPAAHGARPAPLFTTVRLALWSAAAGAALSATGSANSAVTLLLPLCAATPLRAS